MRNIKAFNGQTIRLLKLMTEQEKHDWGDNEWNRISEEILETIDQIQIAINGDPEVNIFQ